MIVCLNRLYSYRCDNTSMMAFLCFLLCTNLLFLSSCGLEVYYDIDPPRSATRPNEADGSTTTSIEDDALLQEFEFTAANVSDFISPGTAVYYRIYNNIDDLQSDARQINNANTENTSNGFTKLESLDYKEMTSSTKPSPIIGGNGGRVLIRLITSGEYPVGISVNGTFLAIPQRNDGVPFSFDPSTASNPENILPKPGDQDYKDSGTDDGENFWYVNAYAVSTGMNTTTVSPVRSEVLSLGFTAYSRPD